MRDSYTIKLNHLVSFIIQETDTEEEWREVSKYDGRYFVSSKGRILSLQQNKYKILKPTLNKDGYYQVSLSCNGK
jgi:hypothetical protein